ncbi:transposase zinc-binding domain-containing protein [Gemmatimonas sp.]
MVRTPIERMLGAPRSRSAHPRYGLGGAWRLHAPAPPGGALDHGFARIRCDDCAHEYLLAFSCKCRYFCPSGHAKRLAIWTQWLDTTLLAPVPHRQVVLTIPKRLRAYCVYRRRLLRVFARVAARTMTAAIRSLTGEHDLTVGIVACLQTHVPGPTGIRTGTSSSPTTASGPTGPWCRGPHTTRRA